MARRTEWPARFSKKDGWSKIQDELKAWDLLRQHYQNEVSVTDYGALGDGVTDDTDAIQSAINDVEDGTVYFPGAGPYLISSTLTLPTDHVVTLRGESVVTEIKCSTSFTGYLITPQYNFRMTNLTLRGRDADGVYLIGNTGDVDIGNSILEHLRLYTADYLIKFDGSTYISANMTIRDVWGMFFRTAGISLARGGANVTLGTDDEGTNLSIDDVFLSNGAFTPQVAGSVVVSANDPDTGHDTLTFSSTGAKEFGWIIQRRATGSSDNDAWVPVARPAYNATSAEIDKGVGESYEYYVLRHTVGLYVSEWHGVNVGSLQCQYVGTGAWFRGCWGVSVGSFYDEWQGYTTPPCPQGTGIRFANTSGYFVGSLHVYNVYDAVHSYYSRGQIQAAVGTGDNGRSIVYLQQTDAYQFVHIGDARVAGTRVVLQTDGAAYANYTLSGVTGLDDGTVKQMAISHVTKSEIIARRRNGDCSKIGAWVDGSDAYGYLWLYQVYGLPTADADNQGQIIRNNDGAAQEESIWACVRAAGGSTYEWERMTYPRRAAAPITGDWLVGDRVYNTTPAVAGGAGSQYIIIGWICTVAGTPGTWVEMRTLTGT